MFSSASPDSPICCAAYFSIPLQLVYFQRKLPVVLMGPQKATLGLFASFILLCGLTHWFNMFKGNSELMLDVLGVSHPRTLACCGV